MELKKAIIALFIAATALFSEANAQNARLKNDAMLYQVRCTQCHPIEMAKVTSGNVLPSEVLAMVKRMQVMPGSLMKDNEMAALFNFTMFDIYSKQRGELEAKLKSLPPAERKKEIAALKKALSGYK